MSSGIFLICNACRGVSMEFSPMQPPSPDEIRIAVADHRGTCRKYQNHLDKVIARVDIPDDTRGL